VAFHISRHLHLAGQHVACIWSRTYEKARRVAAVSGSVALRSIEEIPGDADFYLLAVSDDAVPAVAELFTGRGGIWMHTAGAVSMDVLEGLFKDYGVLYPLQTLSFQRHLSLEDTPFLVEGSSEEVKVGINSLASVISRKVLEMDSADRLKVHLAAVFANNFSNHMAAIGTRLMEESGGESSLLDALLRETFLKMSERGPAAAQTGPALRGDKQSMKKHLELLKGHPEWEKLYTFVSRDIKRSHKSANDPKTEDDQF